MNGTQLIQIQPLNQSSYEVMACAHSYCIQAIDGVRSSASINSMRGTDVHHVLAQYIDHCTRRRVPADWAELDRLSATVGLEAGKIVDGMRDTYEVEYAIVQGTEMTLMLDEMLKPTQDIAAAAHKGTLDVLLRRSKTLAEIQDFKSHPQPFNPDTYQSMLYPFFVFRHYPDVQEVIFRLIFVRYANAVREVRWTRKDLPDMVGHITRARARQARITEQYVAGESVAVVPGSHCNYCPLLASGDCPERYNPYAAMGWEDRVLYAEWLKRQVHHNNQMLRERVQATGQAIEVTTEHGDQIAYGAKPVESKIYPLRESVKLLLEYQEASGENPFEWGDLRVSSTGLKSKLQAKKRAALREMFERIAKTVTKVSMRLHSPRVANEEEQEYGEDY